MLDIGLFDIIRIHAGLIVLNFACRSGVDILWQPCMMLLLAVLHARKQSEIGMRSSNQCLLVIVQWLLDTRTALHVFPSFLLLIMVWTLRRLGYSYRYNFCNLFTWQLRRQVLR